MHHPTDRIAHTTAFVTPVAEHWLEREIAQWVYYMKDRSDDPSHHERTPLPRSYISLLILRVPFLSTLVNGLGHIFNIRMLCAVPNVRLLKYAAEIQLSRSIRPTKCAFKIQIFSYLFICITHVHTGFSGRYAFVTNKPGLD